MGLLLLLGQPVCFYARASPVFIFSSSFVRRKLRLLPSFFFPQVSKVNSPSPFSFPFFFPSHAALVPPTLVRAAPPLRLWSSFFPLYTFSHFCPSQLYSHFSQPPIPPQIHLLQRFPTHVEPLFVFFLFIVYFFLGFIFPIVFSFTPLTPLRTQAYSVRAGSSEEDSIGTPPFCS